MNNPIIEMGKDYPFGNGSKNVEQCDQMLVHKELPFTCNKEKQMIEQLMHFVKSVSHPNLVNLVQTTQQPEIYHFYYQYVPLKLEPWILGVNEELTQQLEQQLLQLVQFLTRASINFKFDPSSVGLSHNMTVKYFLTQFDLDVEGQQKNCQKLQESIRKYMQELKIQAGLANKTNQSKSTRLCSVSTNGSVSHLDEYKSLSKSDCKECSSPKKQLPLQKSRKTQQIYEKVQNSKQKSMQVLLKLKSLNKSKLNPQ